MPNPLSILLVDDEAISALSLSLQLQNAGYPSCQIEGSGEKAVKAALSGSFDVILMDVRLAGKMTGLDAARQIRAAGLETPVIFMSGYADAEYRDETASLNPTAYLVKPIRFAELLRILEHTGKPQDKSVRCHDGV